MSVSGRCRSPSWVENVSHPTATLVTKRVKSLCHYSRHPPIRNVWSCADGLYRRPTAVCDKKKMSVRKIFCPRAYYAEQGGKLLLNTPKRAVLSANTVVSNFPGHSRHFSPSTMAPRKPPRKTSAATTAEIKPKRCAPLRNAGQFKSPLPKQLILTFSNVASHRARCKHQGCNARLL